jgi:hypothetical protein
MANDVGVQMYKTNFKKRFNGLLQSRNQLEQSLGNESRNQLEQSLGNESSPINESRENFELKTGLDAVKLYMRDAGIGFAPDIHELYENVLETLLLKTRPGGNLNPFEYRKKQDEFVPLRERPKKTDNQYRTGFSCAASVNTNDQIHQARQVSAAGGMPPPTMDTIQEELSYVDFPVLASSNMYEFIEESRWVDSTEFNATFRDIQDKIKAYIFKTQDHSLYRMYDESYNNMVTNYKQPTIHDVKLHVTIVITAAIHRRGGRTASERCAALQISSSVGVRNMQTVFGKNAEVRLAHFMDPREESLDYYDTDDYLRKNNSPEIDAFGSVDGMKNYLEMVQNNPEPVVIDVSDSPENSADALFDFLHSTDVIFFVGGETHWLNRQLSRCGFWESVISCRDHQQKHLVFGGYSAGLINLGASTRFTADKVFLRLKADDFKDLHDVYGDFLPCGIDLANKCIESSTKYPPTWNDCRNVWFGAMSLCGDKVFFVPHYNYSNFEKHMDNYKTSLSPIRITDDMIFYIDEGTSDDSWTRKTSSIEVPYKKRKMYTWFSDAAINDFDKTKTLHPACNHRYTETFWSLYHNNLGQWESIEEAESCQPTRWGVQKNLKMLSSTAGGAWSRPKPDRFLVSPEPTRRVVGDGALANAVAIGGLVLLTIVSSFLQA